jgi:hypothetical protein
MPKREELEDYEAREKENIEVLYKEYLTGKNTDVLRKRIKPMGKLVAFPTSFENKALWSHLSIYESTVIPIRPIEENSFEKNYGITLDEFENYVLKPYNESNRFQFVLTSWPTAYEGLSYLDEILEKIKPPVNARFGIRKLIESVSIENYKKKFETAYSNLEVATKSMLVESGEQASQSYVETVTTTFFRDLLWLTKNGYNPLFDFVLSLLNSNNACSHAEAIDCISLLDNLLIDERTSGIKGIRTTSRESYAKLRSFTGKSRPIKAELTQDIGKIFLQTQVPNPLNAESALFLRNKFEDNDLYKLMEALIEFAEKKKVDLFNATSKELEETLSNSLKDAEKTFNRSEKFSEYGVEFALGVVGLFAGQIVGHNIIESLIFSGMSVFVGKTIGDHFPTQITRQITPSHLVALHDFQVKYKVQ